MAKLEAWRPDSPPLTPEQLSLCAAHQLVQASSQNKTSQQALNYDNGASNQTMQPDEDDDDVFVAAAAAVAAVPSAAQIATPNLIPHATHDQPLNLSISASDGQLTSCSEGLTSCSEGLPSCSDVLTNVNDKSNNNNSTSNPDPLKCSVCGKKFSLQRLLNRHMKCHSDVKRYSCAYCGKGFNDTFDLKRHIRTHSGVRPYKCAHCEKSFTQRCSLESHSLKVHGIAHRYAYKERRPKVYVCEECGNTTSSPEVHFNHLRDYHQYSISSQTLAKFYDKRRFKFSS